MALKTRKEYLESLKAMRPNVYKFGKLIQDVTTDPATKRTVESHARAFDASNDPQYAESSPRLPRLPGRRFTAGTA